MPSNSEFQLLSNFLVVIVILGVFVIWKRTTKRLRLQAQKDSALLLELVSTPKWQTALFHVSNRICSRLTANYKERKIQVDISGSPIDLDGKEFLFSMMPLQIPKKFSVWETPKKIYKDCFFNGKEAFISAEISEPNTLSRELSKSILEDLEQACVVIEKGDY